MKTNEQIAREAAEKLADALQGSHQTEERRAWQVNIIMEQIAPLLAAAREDTERLENHLRGVLETTTVTHESNRVDAERFRYLSSKCEELDDDPVGYYFSLPIDGESPDVWERFVAAIDSALRAGQ